MNKNYWIGIPFLKKWIMDKVDDYEFKLNQLNMDELTYIKGKLDILNELMTILNVHENNIIKEKQK